MTYPFVYRHNGPLKGRLCRIIRRADIQRDRDGAIIWNSGEHAVAIEFEDGRRAMVERQAVISARCRLGRAAIRLGRATAS